MKVKIPPGVFDIIPENDKELWRSSYIWNYVELIIRKTATEFGYQEIRTPVFERTELFARGVGETSDIVSKEMYTFTDKGDRSLSLRPEGTAPAMRAFIDNSLQNQGSVHKLFYIGPMFRYERSQAGRYRQHHQFGVEAIGNSSPEQDAEIIDLIYTVYQRLGLKGLKVYINSLGDTESRIRFRTALKEYLEKHFDKLSPDSKRRYETNPLRILDSKAEEDREIVANAPSLLDYLSDECRAHFNAVRERLDAIGIDTEVNPHLVRGLDYYNNTVFEIVSGELGAQNSIVGGGRYDGLLKMIGGPDLPAIGFGCGIERAIQTMINQMAPLPTRDAPTLFIISLGDEAKEPCFKLLHQLRQMEINAEMDFSGKKLNKIMQYADQQRAEYVIVVGDKELEEGVVEIKEMATGRKESIPLKLLPRFLQIEKQQGEFIRAWSTLSAPFETSEEQNFFLNRLNKRISDTQDITKNLETALRHMQEMVNENE
ncbi:MAG: histidine--tRNA ligase [Chlamydiia bacterium]|nr:histidine--tRNA ligase [Chlamydiia bacterium]